jgi:hypothetical protein
VPTIAVFAEILIVGLQAAVWVLLTILAIFGNNWLDLAELKDWETLVTVLILAAAYVLGVLMDRIADSIIGGLGPGRQWARTRLDVLSGARSEDLIRSLEYLRSRVRIARGTSLNFFLIALATLAFGLTRTSALKSPPGIGLLLASVAMLFGVSFVSFFIWTRLEKSYLDDLEWVHRHLHGDAARGIV